MRDVAQAEPIKRSGRDLELGAWISKSDLLISKSDLLISKSDLLISKSDLLISKSDLLISKSDLLIAKRGGSISLNDFSSPAYTKGGQGERKDEFQKIPKTFPRNHYPFIT